MPGRQGTFPNINWNQFSSVAGIWDANHPSDVEEGHEPYASPERKRKFQEMYAPKPPHEEVTGQLPLFPHPDERR